MTTKRASPHSAGRAAALDAHRRPRRHAWTQATPHHHHLLTVYAGWLRASGATITVPEEAELGQARPVLFDPAFGSPTTVAAKLERALGQARTTHLVLGTLPGMAPDVTRQSLERFAHDVRPALHT